MKKSDKDAWTGFNMGRSLFDTPGVEPYDAFITSFIQGILNDKDTAVEYGCGDGVWLRYLAKNNPGTKFIGVEWNDSLYDYCMAQPAKGNLEFVQADISEPEGVFECDVCWSLGGIEHFSEPVTVLKPWVDKLSPDGICFLTVPNLMNRERLKRRFGLPPEVYLGVDWVALDVFGYQEIWAPNYFIRVAMKAGLEVMELGTISGLKAAPLYLKGLRRSDQL